MCTHKQIRCNVPHHVVNLSASVLVSRSKLCSDLEEKNHKVDAWPDSPAWINKSHETSKPGHVNLEDSSKNKQKHVHKQPPSKNTEF